MKRTILLSAVILFIAILGGSCKKDEPTPPPSNNYVKVAEGVSQDASLNVEFCACENLFVGYNKVYFKITRNSNGERVTQASMHLHPIMDMGTFIHACPFENPGQTANADGYFEGAIMFSMIGTDGWSVDLDVTSGTDTMSTHLPIHEVIATNPVKKIVVIDSLETSPGTWVITKYPISLVPPKAWQVGLNTFEITIHQMANMMSFPPVTDMTVEITPEMPSMGHGSPNNVNPVHIENGHYSGVVNYTMTGDWRIHLTLWRGGRLLTNKAYFDILF